MTWITVSITRTAGSAPRNAGTQMQVFADHITGTIGGGALEWAAMAHARHMLSTGRHSDTQTIPLGPNLGQCCGGSVHLSYTANATPQHLDLGRGPRRTRVGQYPRAAPRHGHHMDRHQRRAVPGHHAR